MTDEQYSIEMDRCLLCKSEKVSHFCRDNDSRLGRWRDFYRCSQCLLIFADPNHRLSEKQELERYELHENDPADPDYRKFLAQAFDPLQEKLAPGSYGLDFGSGPGPTLSVMLEEAGHHVDLYDIFFADNRKVFDRRYDFITSTETAEHLFRPRFEFDRLWGCLKPGGWLAIMTRLASSDPNPEQFLNWHYKNDDTHVVFYTRETFQWLGNRWETQPEFYPGDVILFCKSA
ncbi:MAG: class I SAM-dependent methyltransferase [Balneolaceae bacterium]